MADLRKIIKVTQAQYSTLASGGSITYGGETYTGLDNNYIYLVANNTEYLPLTGGTLTNYEGTPLIIRFNNDDYYFMKIYTAQGDTTNYYQFDGVNGGGKKDIELPGKSGTLALTSNASKIYKHEIKVTGATSGTFYFTMYSWLSYQGFDLNNMSGYAYELKGGTTSSTSSHYRISSVYYSRINGAYTTYIHYNTGSTSSTTTHSVTTLTGAVTITDTITQMS